VEGQVNHPFFFLLLLSAVLVAFLRRQRAKFPNNLQEETLQWLLTVLLGIVNRPGSQPNSRDEIVTRTCISHVLRAGLSAGAPEAVQLSLARYLVRRRRRRRRI